TSVTGAFINILVNVLFIRLLGLYAVVVSTFLAFFITWLIRVWTAQPHFRITMDRRDTVILFTLLPVAIILPHFLNQTGMVISICCALLLFLGYNFKLLIIAAGKIRMTLRKIGTETK